MAIEGINLLVEFFIKMYSLCWLYHLFLDWIDSSNSCGQNVQMVEVVNYDRR